MHINKLLGQLTPAHPDIIPILKTIREKYNLPEIAPGDDTLAEILGGENEIDLKVLHQDIETELRNNPDLLPSGTDNIFRILQAKDENNLELPELKELSIEIRESFQALLEFVFMIFEPYRTAIDGLFSTLADNLMYYMLTGETQDLPENWFQTAYTTNMMGEPVIVAMCNQAADPKEVAELLKAQYTRTFGKDRPKITSGQMNSVEFLRMKWEGKSIAYLVDIYAENHPSQFPEDFQSKEYRSAKDKHYQLMKKNLQRFEKQIDKLWGTKKT